MTLLSADRVSNVLYCKTTPLFYNIPEQEAVTDRLCRILTCSQGGIFDNNEECNGWRIV